MNRLANRLDGRDLRRTPTSIPTLNWAKRRSKEEEFSSSSLDIISLLLSKDPYYK